MSGLFISVGGILYERSSTRFIYFYKGIAQLMPLFSLLFFILCLANAGTPLTLNFIGEFMSLYGALWGGILLLCQQLSNYEGFLKFLAPNYIRKVISGWISKSCMVISQILIERKMEYCVSKSIIGLGKLANYKPVIVKEQRIYSSWQFAGANCLRCILTGFERNYQIIILSNQVNKKIFYTTQVVQPVGGGRPPRTNSTLNQE